MWCRPCLASRDAGITHGADDAVVIARVDVGATVGGAIPRAGLLMVAVALAEVPIAGRGDAGSIRANEAVVVVGIDIAAGGSPIVPAVGCVRHLGAAAWRMRLG